MRAVLYMNTSINSITPFLGYTLSSHKSKKSSENTVENVTVATLQNKPAETFEPLVGDTFQKS